MEKRTKELVREAHAALRAFLDSEETRETGALVEAAEGSNLCTVCKTLGYLEGIADALDTTVIELIESNT
jgi:hypothetical protein